MSRKLDSSELLLNNYTEEYAALIERAIAGDYRHLYENFLALADLYVVLERLAAIEGTPLEVESPLMLFDREALKRLGYSPQQLARLDTFINWVGHKTRQDFRTVIASRLAWSERRAA